MKLLETIIDWAKQTKVEIKQEEESIYFPVNGDNGSWFARVSALEEDGVIFIVTAFPFQVAEERRTETAIALGNITRQLKMGAFYIRVEDGQINFRISQKISTEANRDIWIREFILLAMNATDSYFRRMMGFAAQE